jgi:tRNA pseudouridine38-40 synthase
LEIDLPFPLSLRNFVPEIFHLTTDNRLLTIFLVYRYFIRLSYNGNGFCGWQIQPGVATIQETVNEKLSLLLHEKINCVGCGRTDSGVHAKKFYAHFDCERDDLDSNEQIIFRLNKMLPPGIAIQDIRKMISNAHARFAAFSRSYEYHISTVKDPFAQWMAWEHREILNVEAMNNGAKILMTYDDFKAFSKTSDSKTSICKMTNANWKEEGKGKWSEGKGEKLIFEISANRFLRNMVRAIVGTLLDVGRGKINEDELHRIIKSGDRSEAGMSVPAHGLYLTEILYPAEYNL